MPYIFYRKVYERNRISLLFLFLISLNMLISSSVSLPGNGILSFFFLAELNYKVYMHPISLSVHLLLYT